MTIAGDTVVPCCSVPVLSVPLSIRDSWCDTQQNTCVGLCGGQGNIANNGNTCNSVSILKKDKRTRITDADTW